MFNKQHDTYVLHNDDVSVVKKNHRHHPCYKRKRQARRVTPQKRQTRTDTGTLLLLEALESLSLLLCSLGLLGVPKPFPDKKNGTESNRFINSGTNLVSLSPLAENSVRLFPKKEGGKREVSDRFLSGAGEALAIILLFRYLDGLVACAVTPQLGLLLHCRR